MRKTSILLTLTLALFLPVLAGAQMMGGGNHHGSIPVTPPSNGMHGGNGNMHGGGNDPMNGMMSCPMAGGHGMNNGLTVASDGTLLLTRTGEPTAKPQLLAVRGGSVRWTRELAGAMTKMLVDGERVITVTQSSTNDEMATPKTTVAAYVLATGAMIWTIDLDGSGRDAARFDGGFYLVLGRGQGEESMEEGHCDGGMNGGLNEESMMKSSVAAVSAEGKVLWTLPLQP